MEGSSLITPKAEESTTGPSSLELSHEQLSHILDDSLPSKGVFSGLFEAPRLQSWSNSLLTQLAAIQNDPNSSDRTTTATAAYMHALMGFRSSLANRELTAELVPWMWQDFLSSLWNEYTAAERDPGTGIDGPASLTVYAALHAAQEQAMNQRSDIMQACAEVGGIVDGWANVSPEDKRALVDQFLQSKLISPVNHRGAWANEDSEGYSADDQWDWVANVVSEARSVMGPLAGSNHGDGSTVYFDSEEEPWVESPTDDIWVGSNIEDAESPLSMAVYARDQAEGILSAIPPNSWGMAEGDVEMLGAFATALVVTAATVLLGYVGLLLLLLVAKSQQRYFVHFYWLKYLSPGDFDRPEKYGLLPHSVYNGQVVAADGIKLGFWHVLPQTYDAAREVQVQSLASVAQRQAYFEAHLTAAPLVILYFHGQSGSRERASRVSAYKALHAAAPRAHLVALDYRGYGDSSGTPDDEAMVTLDALAIWDYLVQRVPPRRILLYGHSLGTGVAAKLCQLAEKRDQGPLGLCLEGAYESITNVMMDYPTIPILRPFRKSAWLTQIFVQASSFHLDTWRRLPLLRTPTLLIHGRLDRDILIQNSINLFAALSPDPTTRSAKGQCTTSVALNALCPPQTLFETGDLYRWASPLRTVWYLELFYSDHDGAHQWYVTRQVLEQFFQEIAATKAPSASPPVA
ncbi:hypothetical protein H4R34_000333 [Dimargaris verticillata]|uniref:AB hydrolase-1 domain-containing protein n=1 Tax=Dimargaris verticillata TaxID=2761393 RepID=A0A9W8EBF4_9FUNG|nr:hypothetical protein H4R34_000333 [Dimargaris verticillata]